MGIKTDYIGYFKYILEHKRNVFKTCWQRGLYLHAFTHDLSKFLPCEFIPYAKWFYGEYGVKVCDTIHDMPIEVQNKHKKLKENFRWAWVNHYNKNKHHWEHWHSYLTGESENISNKYILQMICDWEGMALKFGDSAQEYYMNNYDKIELSLNSRLALEVELGLIDETCIISNVTWKDYCNKNNITMKEDLKKLGYIK